MIQMSTEKRGAVWFTVALNERKQLVACSFSDNSQKDAENTVRDVLRSKTQARIADSANSKTITALFNIFKGSGGIDSDAVDLSHVSTFQKKVYDQLCRIPRGHVTTYGAIAKKLGSISYARTVGTAVASNPLPLLIPCHRVVPSSLKVGNYGMPGRKPNEGGYMKHRILEREGVKFQGDKVRKESLWSPN